MRYPRCIASTARYGEAIAAFDQLLVVRRRVLGDNDLDTLKTRSNIATWLGEAAQYDEAIVAFEQLLEDQRRVLGDDDPGTLRTRSRLAYWLGRAGRDDESIATFEQLLIDRRRVLGDSDPDTFKLEAISPLGWVEHIGLTRRLLRLSSRKISVGCSGITIRTRS